MNHQWHNSLLRIGIWVMIEILLNLLNLDTLGDYSEFVFEQKRYRNSHHLVLCSLMIVPRTTNSRIELSQSTS